VRFLVLITSHVVLITFFILLIFFSIILQLFQKFMYTHTYNVIYIIIFRTRECVTCSLSERYKKNFHYFFYPILSKFSGFDATLFCYELQVTSYELNVLNVSPHTSNLSPHTLNVSPHTSHLLPHTSFCFSSFSLPPLLRSPRFLCWKPKLPMLYSPARE